MIPYGALTVLTDAVESDDSRENRMVDGNILVEGYPEERAQGEEPPQRVGTPHQRDERGRTEYPRDDEPTPPLPVGRGTHGVLGDESCQRRAGAISISRQSAPLSTRNEMLSIAHCGGLWGFQRTEDEQQSTLARLDAMLARLSAPLQL